MCVKSTFACVRKTGNFANEWQGIGNNEPYLHFKALSQHTGSKPSPDRVKVLDPDYRGSKSVTELASDSPPREGLREIEGESETGETRTRFGASKLRELSVAGLHTICFMAMACTLNAHLITRTGRGHTRVNQPPTFYQKKKNRKKNTSPPPSSASSSSVATNQIDFVLGFAFSRSYIQI